MIEEITSFNFNTTPRIIYGPNVAKDAGSYAKLMGNRILLVTDKGLSDLGLYEDLLRNLEKHGAKVNIFDDVEADPSLQTLEKAIKFGKEFACTGVLGFGGGSSMDVAKLSALVLGSGEDLESAWGVANAIGPRLPLCLIPTTAGTGSEVTPVSIITVDGDEKRGVSSPIILPDFAVLDPVLTLGLPAATTAATGIDAMVHAIEAYASKNKNNNPMSGILAKEALVLLGSSIKLSVLEPKDLNTRPLKDLTKESIFNIIQHSNKFKINFENSEILDLFSGPKSKFLSLEYSERLFSTKWFNLSKALALDASKFILDYFDFFFLSPNLSLCLNLKITIAPAIRTIATAS